MSNQQPKRPAQVARVVPPQERQVTAAEIRNALQSMVRRLERVEEKVDRLTSMAESSLSEPETPRLAPAAAAPAVDAEAETPTLPATDDESAAPAELRVVADTPADTPETVDPVADTGTMEPEPDAPSLVTGPVDAEPSVSSFAPPPPLPGSSAPEQDPEERIAEERHSRIADRFAERAPEPLDVADADAALPSGDQDGVEQEAAPEATPTFAAQGPLNATAPSRRRRGRSAGRVAFWAVIATAVVVGGAYMVLNDAQETPDDQTTDSSLADQEPDETIPVPGQSPLQDDDAADAAPEEAAGVADEVTGTEGEPAQTASVADGVASNEAVGDPSVEMGPVPGETSQDDPEALTADGSEPEAETAEGVEATGGEEADVEDGAAAGPTTEATAEEGEADAVEDGAAESAADEPGSTESAAPELSSDPGPEVASLPVTEVETVELSDLAPLPDNAPDDLRQVAALALEGNPEAQHDLATSYAIGTTIPQNFERAAFWYARSADAGIVNARYNLGVLTERGLGVGQDSEAAFEMFLEAANAGHPDAENAVGLAYMLGNGTDRDLVQAATWFQAASAQGNPRGAFHLGRLFEEGLDGAPDLTAAAGWYRVAAEAGDAQAVEALARISPAIGEGGIPEAVDVPIPETTPEPATPGTAQDLAVTAEEIRQIQVLLAEQGYDPGPADGVMGPATRGAIEAFEQDNNLSISGEPSFSLLDALRAAPTGDETG